MSPSIFTTVINSYLSEPHASLLNGILFGIPLRATQSFYNNLRTAGLLHIVVLSGMNISLLGALIGSITLFMGKRISVLITIASIIIFIIFVGPAPPVVRAGIMGIISLLAIIYGRKYTALYCLFLSALIIAVVNFKWLTTISFQLSYGATLGIILFGKASNRNFIVNELKTSLAAQIFTVPIIFFYFKQISFIAPLSNVLVAPTIGPLMVFGFITAILGKLSYVLGYIPSLICYAILNYIVWVVELCSRIPFAAVNM